MKEKLISVTAKDCRWDYYRGTGAGGQKRNKTSNCVRCTHIDSGAVGKSEEGRSQAQNKKKAFRRMAETLEFQNWLRLKCAEVCGELKKIEEKVEEMMDEKYLKIELGVEDETL